MKEENNRNVVAVVEEEKNRNVVALVEEENNRNVVVVEGKQLKCGGGGLGGGKQ